MQIEIKILVAAYDREQAWAIFYSDHEVGIDVGATSPAVEDFMGADESNRSHRPPSDGLWVFEGTFTRPSRDAEGFYRGVWRRPNDAEIGALGVGENPFGACGE